MQVSHVRCPHCGTGLRIRDRKYLGRRIRCPDCREPVRIVADGPRQVTVEQLAEPPAENPTSAERRRPGLGPLMSRLVPTVPAGLLRRAAAWARCLTNPLVISWTVAGGTAVALIVTVAGPWGRQPTPTAPADTAPASAATADEQDRPPPENASPGGNRQSSGTERERIQRRLVRLGDQLSQYAEDRGHFPPGTVRAEQLGPRKRFSWLAALAAENEPAGTGPPLWDQPWDAPLNAPFVRRRIPGYQNPAVPEKTGENGYPAGHFAGVAGVGEDGPRLPVDHPRAGVFGFNRRTTVDDIKDGAANTMMITGVQDRLGSWAAGGHPTLRPLTSEPYVNGPDGLGTGQPDGMHVLMADGGVRFLSENTDPRILRRMAAMADGLDLQLQTPGEPGDRPPSEEPPHEPPPVASDDERPAPQPVAAPRPEPQPADEQGDRRPVDVRAALAQPILEFRQPQPAPFEDVLMDVEEMAGVPIRDRIDPQLPPEIRSKAVSLHLRRTSVGGILKTLLKKVGLRYTIQNNEIHLHRINE